MENKTIGEKPKHSPPWIFGLLYVPYGIAGAFTSTTLGAILQKYQVDKNKVASAIAASILIATLQFLWTPTVDIGLRRRTWYIIMAFLGAITLMVAMCVSLPAHVDLFIGLILLGQVFVTLTGPCVGGLMATTLPDEVRGKAAGFANAGNVGAGAVAAGISLTFLESHSLPVVGAVTATMMALPSLIALAVPEAQPIKRKAKELFTNMLRDVWNTAKQRPGWSGMLFCISPVGTAAAMQLFTSYSDDYKASAPTVALINGYLGGVVTGVACVIGGYLCDRVNRRIAYLMTGIATAVCAVLMGFAPLTPNTYIIGSLAYLFVTGFCYAAFTAVVLEIIGNAGASASTQYVLFTAAGNLAISYVVKLEGYGYTWWEKTYGQATAARGALYSDAALNMIGVVILMILIFMFKIGTHDHKPEPKAA